MTMRKSQVADVLTLAASFDARTVGNADVEAWFLAIGDLDFEETMAAVIEHYKTSTDRLMPAHLIPEDETGVPPWERKDAPGRDLTPGSGL